MKYDAITLDTNIFRNNGYNLESGLLSQLTQFKTGSVRLVLSEIVFREMQRHLIRNNLETKASIERSLRDAQKSQLIPEATLSKIHTLISAEVDGEIAAKNRLKKFLEDTGAVVIEARHASIEALIKCYFETSAPFEESGKKKNEFPDAIALLSLEDWAKKNSARLLAVSDDRGWQDYADLSEAIDNEKDISKAFQVLQDDVESARQLISSLLVRLSNGESPSLLKEMDDYIQREVGALDPLIDAQSYLSYVEELEDLSCEHFEFITNGDAYEFTITQIGTNKIVVKIPLIMKIKASAYFNFYIYDSIDKDNVSMGGASYETEDELHTYALVTFEGDFHEVHLNVSITQLTLLEANPIISFGDIEPFREQEYEELP